MKNFLIRFVFSLILVMAFIPGAAFAASVSVTNVSATTITAKQLVTFAITPTGFSAPMYKITDSFPNSTLTSSAVNAGGNFSWVPVVSDVGTHTLTVSASDFSGNEASSAITITVLPLPTVSIQRTPAGDVPVNTRVSFSVSQTGFVNPIYSVSDDFSGSSIANVTLDATGSFSWTPDIAQQGSHTVTVYVSDSTGHSASASAGVYVGPRPSIKVFNILSGNAAPVGNTIPIGTTTTFSVVATAFTPTVYGVSDSFVGTSLSPNAVSNYGLFIWTPAGQDIGTHVLTITGSIGPFGKSATTSVTLNVYDPAKTGAAGTAAPALKSTTPPTQSSAQQSASVVPAAPSGGYRFMNTLAAGSEGEEVRVLQALLSGLGYLSATPTGYFGPATEQAVRKFQAANGIAQLGIVGPQTRTKLNALSGAAPAAPANPATPAPTTSTSPASTTGNTYVFEHFMGYGQNPDDGPDVIELQKRLTALGFFSGEPTGFFGNVTVAAVKKFQTARGIEATGYVGKETRAALNR